MRWKNMGLSLANNNLSRWSGLGQAFYLSLFTDSILVLAEKLAFSVKLGLWTLQYSSPSLPYLPLKTPKVCAYPLNTKASHSFTQQKNSKNLALTKICSFSLTPSLFCLLQQQTIQPKKKIQFEISNLVLGTSMLIAYYTSSGSPKVEVMLLGMK